MRGIGLRMGRCMPVQQCQQMRPVGIPIVIGGMATDYHLHGHGKDPSIDRITQIFPVCTGNAAARITSSIMP